jgi:GT2 family glycosyltransferase
VSADLVAVIVAHNSSALLPSCLTALVAAAGDIETRIVVADSGSSDGVETLCEELGVEFLAGENRGLGAAFNRARRLEAVASARYVLQLNPDVLLPPGGLEALVRLADERPRCGILAPRQLDEHGQLIISIGVEPTVAEYRRGFTALRCDWVWQRERYERDTAADWVMGACMLLRREMLAQIGGFDERFFLCSEEVDLCRRARDAGWSVEYTPAVTVVHALAERPIDAHRVRLEEWSRILYLRKWHSVGSRFAMRLALAARFARLAAIDVRQGRPGDSHIRLVATLHFDRSRYGPAPPVS